MEEKLVDNEQMKSQGLSGSTLKIIAMISMFIDHATSVLLERYIVYRGMSFDLTQSTGPKSLIILDLILRGIINKGTLTIRENELDGRKAGR